MNKKEVPDRLSSGETLFIGDNKFVEMAPMGILQKKVLYNVIFKEQSELRISGDVVQKVVLLSSFNLPFIPKFGGMRF